MKYKSISMKALGTSQERTIKLISLLFFFYFILHPHHALSTNSSGFDEYILDGPKKSSVYEGKLPLVGRSNKNFYSTKNITDEVDNVLKGNQKYRPYPRKPIHQLIFEQAEKTPDAIALMYEKKKFTYAQFNQITNQLAYYLINRGVGPETIVPICLERSENLAFSIIGTLKANAAYMPISDEYPPERIHFMVNDAKAPLIITSSKFKHKFEGCNSHVMLIDLVEEELKQFNSNNPPVLATLANLAYVIYTSGSTGQPKGVCNIHKGLMNRIWWMQEEYTLDDKDTVLQKTPYNFDVSVWEFVWPFIAGACLCVAPPEAHKDPQQLVNIINTYGITTLHFVPSMLSIFLEEKKINRWNSLRLVFSSGEALSYNLQQMFYKHISHAKLHNLYGPTEAAIDVSYWECIKDHPLGYVPIGKSIANVSLLILDENLRLVSCGEKGELYIGGDALARGYLNQEKLTSERFIKNPFPEVLSCYLYRTGDLASYIDEEMNIQYHGRMDNQIKIHGIRIEPQEIEIAINKHPKVKQSVVIARDDSMGSKVLVAYIVPSKKDEINSDNLKKYLFDYSTLSPEMIPSLIVFLDAFPTTPNGKIDIKALPEPSLGSAVQSVQFVKPRDEVEESLARIWKEVLNLKDISVKDAFSQIGGDSIRAIQLLQKMRKEEFKVNLSVLLSNNTIEKLAQYLGKSSDDKDDSPRLKLLKVSPTLESLCAAYSYLVEDVYPISSMQAFMLTCYNRNGRGEYHYQQTIDIDDMDFNEEYLIESLHYVIQANPILRAFFIKDIKREETYQVVRKYEAMKINIPQEDLQALSEEEQIKNIETYMEMDRKDLFNCFDDNENLFRFKIFKLRKNHSVLLMSIHHALFDGWSNIELLKELYKYYKNLKSNKALILPEKPNTHKEFVALEKEIETSKKAESFWELFIDNHSSVIERIPVHLTEKMNPRVLRIDRDFTLNSSKEALVKNLGVSLKGVFLSVFIDSLSTLLNRTSVVTGIVANGRSERLTAPLDALGLFWNIVPFLGQTNTDKRVQIKQIDESLIMMEPYVRYPLTKILSQKNRENLFMSTFNFLNFHNLEDLESTSTTRVKVRSFYDKFHYPLNFIVTLTPNSSNLNFRLEYDDLYITESKACSFMNDYIVNLNQHIKMQL